MILALTQEEDILEIDATTLAQVSTTPALLSNFIRYDDASRITQDGDLLIPVGSRLKKYRPGPGRRNFTEQEADQTLPVLASSAAGNAMLAYSPISASTPVNIVDPHTLTVGPFVSSAPISVIDVLGDRFGERWALVGEPSHGDSIVQIYNRDGALLGSVDAGRDSYVGRLLNRDGTRLYLSFGERGGGSAPSRTPVLEIYDLSAEPVMGQYPLLRSLPLGSARTGILGLSLDESEILLTDGQTVAALPLDAEPETPPTTP